MDWRVYKVVLKLQTPMHIGYRKVGNLQMTRPYVTGRVLWGALTARLTRNYHQNPSHKDYQDMGKNVSDNLRFTYFYPALQTKGQKNEYDILWPWAPEESFRYRTLSGYASTALEYPQRAAEEGMLHETEFISPRTRDVAKCVYLIGYIFEKEGNTLEWQKAIRVLQLGGERGYGWGLVTLVGNIEQMTGSKGKQILFDDAAIIADLSGSNPIIEMKKDSRLIAHTLADGDSVKGNVEPIVGFEWVKDANTHSYQKIAFSSVCYTPGSTLFEDAKFAIKKHGLLEKM